MAKVSVLFSGTGMMSGCGTPGAMAASATRLLRRGCSAAPAEGSSTIMYSASGASATSMSGAASMSTGAPSTTASKRGLSTPGRTLTRLPVRWSRRCT